MKNSLINITKRFLGEIGGAKVTETTIERALNNHPNFSSALSISDALKEWGIENYIITHDKNKKVDFSKYPLPFIAQINSNNDEFVVVKDVSTSERRITFYSDFEGEKDVKQNEFISVWKNIALLAFPNGTIEEYAYESKRNNEILFSKKPLFLTLCLVSFFVGVTYLLWSSIFILFIFLLKMIGLIISIILLRFEFLKKGGRMIDAVCSFGKKSSNGCKNILKFNSAKLFGKISWSELGLLYFSGSSLAIFFNTNNIEASIPFLFCLNLVTLFFIPYSLYYQKFIAREWCYFCLGTLLIFFCEFLIYNWIFNSTESSIPDFKVFVSFFLGLIIPTITYLLLAPLVKKGGKHANLLSSLNYLKFRDGIFDYLLRSSTKIKHIKNVNPIVLKETKEQEKNEIIIATNPSCLPCKDEYLILETLMNGFYPTLSVRLILAADNEKTTTSYIVGLRLFGIYQEFGSERFKVAISDWYRIMDFQKWIKKHPFTKELSSFEDGFRLHLNLAHSNINRTPTTYFNGFALPAPYKLSDIKYLIE